MAVFTVDKCSLFRIKCKSIELLHLKDSTDLNPELIIDGTRIKIYKEEETDFSP